MLSDEEKNKIRLEETYRNEIKQIIDSSKTQKGWISSFTGFVGSPLGLWILSAIFLTFGVKFYEDYVRNTNDKNETNEKIQKIDLEIGYRFCHVLVDLFLLTDGVRDNEKLKKDISIDSVKTVALSLQRENTNYSLYSEFKGYSLIALMAEQQRLLAHINKSDPKLDRAIEDITGLQVFYQVRKIDFSNVRQVAGTIEDELLIQRWNAAGFYFFEGGKDTPFS